MAHSERIDLKPILPFLPPEPGLRAHLFRVSALAWRAAQFNGYSEEAVQNIGWAAFLHHHEATETPDNPVPKELVRDLGLEAVAGFAPLPERAAAIVRAFRRQDAAPDQADVEAAYLLESANLFDEQMENLPYEELPTDRAVEELLESGMIAPPFRQAIDSFRTASWQELAATLVRTRPISPGGQADPNELGDDTTELEQTVRRTLETGRDNSLWVHSQDVAAELAKVAGESSKLDRREAFIAGLVHDIGRIAFRDSAAAADVNRWQSLGFPVTYAEFLVSGADHAALGAEILTVWGFPATLVEAVANHHRPELTQSALAAAIYAFEDFDELLPSCARDHLAAKRVDLSEVRHLGAAG